MTKAVIATAVPRQKTVKGLCCVPTGGGRREAVEEHQVVGLKAGAGRQPVAGPARAERG